MQQIHRSTRRSCEMFNFNSAPPKVQPTKLFRIDPCLSTGKVWVQDSSLKQGTQSQIVVPKMSIWFDSWRWKKRSFPKKIISPWNHPHPFGPWQLWRCTTWRQRCFTTNNCNQWFDRVNRSTRTRRSVWPVGAYLSKFGMFFFLPKHQKRMVLSRGNQEFPADLWIIFSYFAALNDLDHKWQSPVQKWTTMKFMGLFCKCDIFPKNFLVYL